VRKSKTNNQPEILHFARNDNQRLRAVGPLLFRLTVDCSPFTGLTPLAFRGLLLYHLFAGVNRFSGVGLSGCCIRRHR